MEVSDVANAVGLLGVLLYFFIPTMVVIFTAYTIRRLKERKKKKAREIVIKEDTILDEPVDKSLYTSLELHFDKTGHVIKVKK